MNKKYFFTAITVLAIAALLSFKPGENKKDLAQVNQYKGLYIFTDSRPVMEYQVLGSVKPKGRAMMALGAKSVQYMSMRDAMIKAAKNDYPDADGVILTFSEGSGDNCDAIKFK